MVPEWLVNVGGEALVVLEQSVSVELLQRVGVAAAVMLLGWVIAKVATGMLTRMLRRRVDAQGAMIARLLVYYGVMVVFGLAALQQLGVELSVLVGAAGVLTVAIGFAAQTSAANVISGLFLLGEQPFVIGDIIQVSGQTGEVVSIDLMSVKLRTFANLLVRVPNETLLKSEITNLTHFPIRRFDLQVRIRFGVDLTRARAVLKEVADAHPLSLDEPAPLILFVEFGESGAQVQFSVWAATPSYLDLANSIPDRVREAFEAEGIPFGVPERILHVASGAPVTAEQTAGTIR